MSASVFISYSNLDRMVAEALCSALEASGTRCWIAPRDISPSREWAEEIIDGINGAQVMLLVFSSRSNGSPQVRREIERAIHKEVPVIPFRIENVIPTKSLEYFLSAQHWFDAFEAPVDTYLPRLCDLIVRLCKTSAGQATTQVPAADRGVPFTGNPYATFAAMPVPAAPAPPAAPAAAPVTSFAATASSGRATEPATGVARNGFPEAFLALLETQLAAYIGPIARIIVRKSAARTTDQQSLLAALASELDMPVERTAFLAACRQRLDH
ncbi:MAG: toll/interleukin-1 receptor domain-containing protein [Herminiimonas sp.]|nr:toll/interleukin-1 receptor domain-containing protein [Herminiimonas sp.]